MATQRSNECACPWLSTSGLFPVLRCSARSIKFNMLRDFCESNIAGNLFFCQMNHYLNELAPIIPRINEDLCGSKRKRGNPV